jgi:GxxExxY protein
MNSLDQISGIDRSKLHMEVTEIILNSCFQVINELGAGFLEKVYKNALAFTLRQQGIPILIEKELRVYFRGQIVGTYVADMIVDNKVIVELKCCKLLLPEHKAQVINYLKASEIFVGLLVNFGKAKLEYNRLWK